MGAFGYDLLFQFDPIELKLPRGAPEGPAPVPLRRHLLHGPQEGAIERYQYDFERDALSTLGLDARRTAGDALPRDGSPEIVSDHTPEEYMAEGGDGPRRA